MASPTFRFAPTPVVRPYTGRRAVTSRAVCQAARAAAAACGATVTRASSRATAATPAHVSDVPSATMPGPITQRLLSWPVHVADQAGYVTR